MRVALLIRIGIHISTLVPMITCSSAAELKVFGSVAVQIILKDSIIPAFEHETGHKVGAEFSSAASLKQRIDRGESFDLAILTPVQMVDQLVNAGVIASDAHGNFGRAGLGLAIREGAPKPDITTVESFKSTLTAAKSIAMTDPATGGVGAVYFMKLMDSFGLADDVKRKLKPTKPGDAALAVASGEAELGMAGIAEIVTVPGVHLVGPLPDEIQFNVGYATGVSAKSNEPAAARQLLKFFSSPSSAAAIKARGMDPG